MGELVTSAIESFINSFMASLRPLTWFRCMGVEALYWAGGGYFACALLLAILLSRREQRLRKGLGI